MLQYHDLQILLGPAVKSRPNIIRINSEKNNKEIHNSLPDLSNSFLAKSDSNDQQCKSKKDIYVCTFCQVFSPHLQTVTQHISLGHSELLPVGTKPENFVSKLQPLQENSQKKRGKVGRPRKIQEERVTPVEQKQPVAEPVPDSNGLFWCKVCLRNFRKSRQLVQHICLDPEDEISSEESSIELEGDVEFRTHMNIDPVPFSRRKRIRTSKENTNLPISDDQSKESSVSETKEEIPENKVAPYWRNDPSYIPLFDDEKEKAAFEEHLRSIDYSYVDHLFQVEEKRCRNKSKSNCVYVQSVVYSCNYCKKNFKSLSCVRLHCLTHTDYKPFTCPKCSYKSNSKGSLYMHMRVHTGNVFSCSSCDFKCFKRSHLLDHEATHTSVYQICKLCKNSYKTVRSLVSHIRKYHNHAGGKRYAKSLTCKQTKEFKCDICNKKFKSLEILNNHNHACHETSPAVDKPLDGDCQPEQNSEKSNHVVSEAANSSSVELQSRDMSCNSIAETTKDPLAEIVINNFLQQHQQSGTVMYENVFNHSNENILSSSNNLLSAFHAKTVADRFAAETSIFEECQKTLNLDIINECLQSSGFSNNCQEFNLLPNISRKHSLQSNSSNGNSHLNEISEDKLEEEPKSAEIKLFEKCQRAPAYVCCVCSSIYICPATLKAHLKEHVNNTNSSFMVQSEEQFEEPTKIAEATTSELDVCQILQDSSESCSYDEKELEKLYSSSLDMMYYLPEVSVVLENDPALFDSMLDDITNFPLSDATSHDLNDKEAEESVLKCFPGL